MKKLLLLLTIVSCSAQGLIVNPYRFGAAAPFTPTTLSGLSIWIDASDNTMTFTDTSLTTPATTDGTAVAGVKNKVGLGTNAVQTTSGKRPVLKTALYNSKNCLRFDGADDCMQIASVSLPTYFSIFVVGKFTTSSSYMFIEHSATINPGPGFFFYGAGSSGMWDVTRSGVLHNSTGALDWMTANLSQVDFRYNGAGEVRADGTIVSNASVSGTARSNSVATDTLNLMSRDQSTLFSSGDLCEVLIYDTCLSDADATLVRAYLKAKWGTP